MSVPPRSPSNATTREKKLTTPPPTNFSKVTSSVPTPTPTAETGTPIAPTTVPEKDTVIQEFVNVNLVIQVKIAPS